MLCQRRLLIWLSIVLLLEIPRVAHGVSLTQTPDTFTGSTDSWTDGHAGNNVLVVATGGPNGANDGFLQVSSGSFGVEPRMITFNQSTNWTGNYTTAGVGSISMELKNFGTAAVPIRIAILDQVPSAGGGPGWSSTTAFSLPADGNWHLAQFVLNAANMTAVGTPDPLAAVLSNVVELRLLSSTAPAILGDSISSRIGVDDITALPTPPVAWTGASSTSWSATGNWTGTVPGVAGGSTTTNTDTATFNRNATNSPTVIDTGGRNVKNLTFDTSSVNSLTVGAVAGPSLLLTSGGATQTTSTVANAEIVNAPLVLEGNYTFTSGATSSTATLTFGGGITPGPTTGVTTLTLNGANTGANNIKGVLADHTGGLLAVAKSGAGAWILSGANTYSGGTTVSAGTLEFDTAPTLPNNATFQVNGGTLRFKVSAAPASVGTGVSVTVSSGATLELAGTASALAAGLNRANISNGSTTPAGVLVTGTNQVVGTIDGLGTTQVNAGDSLTANHIVQAALTIGGTSTSHATVTIGASNASGNPTADLSQVLGASSLGASLVGAVPADVPIAGDSLNGIASDSSGSSMAIGSRGAVPEPSTLVLLATAGLAIVLKFGRANFRNAGKIR